MTNLGKMVCLFPHLRKDTAQTFLLELCAKGYRLCMVVADLSNGYAQPLAA